MVFWSQPYQTLISSLFRFLLLSLSVCSISKYCLYFKTAKLNSKKWKNSSFYEEKSLVGLVGNGLYCFSMVKRAKVVQIFQLLVLRTLLLTKIIWSMDESNTKESGEQKTETDRCKTARFLVLNRKSSLHQII